MPEAARLAIVLSHPTQYYSPWFRWLRTHTALEFRVFYLWDFGATPQRDPQFRTTFAWDVDLLSGYAHEFVPNTAREPGTHHARGLRNPTLLARLAAWRPNAVLLFGYKWESHLRVIWWARRRRIPLLFRGDSHFLGRGAPPPLTRLALRALFAQFASFLPVGSANRDYFRALGVPARKLHFAPHAVNDAWFNPDDATQQRAAAVLRHRLGLAPGTRVLLFAGKLVAAKQPGALLEAFLAAAVPHSALVFVGDGPEKSALQARARAAAAGAIHFLPFANQSEMPARYLLGDVFALPSRGAYETWGLAVNEAMHMARPCVVSDVVGCQRDLVEDGCTGWVFPATDTIALTGAVRAALSCPPAEIARLGVAARERVAGYAYPKTTDGLLRALAAAGVGVAAEPA